ncbi:hypothetical protein ACFV8Z_50515 [Streptomyces sp. NPDC059837]|uniref:hypothetical protein n=1 Tax=unclassified Streptomyces TaxID=2593676 RepID=UPI00225B3D40|nr:MULTISPECIES: hypothetical protein [unclassified Streptomyces]MCX4404747.1 hypothetical protein [Streptomyces sp. NBC_01764]MCX5190706.1 hypothetical protein [Streptomyces sp. NBC_00268]
MTSSPTPQAVSYVIELLPERTGGRGISVVYRYSQNLDSALTLWLIAGVRSDHGHRGARRGGAGTSLSSRGLVDDG